MAAGDRGPGATSTKIKTTGRALPVVFWRFSKKWCCLLKTGCRETIFIGYLQKHST
jgi:hypothetical protein